MFINLLDGQREILNYDLIEFFNKMIFRDDLKIIKIDYQMFKDLSNKYMLESFCYNIDHINFYYKYFPLNINPYNKLLYLKLKNKTYLIKKSKFLKRYINDLGLKVSFYQNNENNLDVITKLNKLSSKSIKNKEKFDRLNKLKEKINLLIKSENQDEFEKFNIQIKDIIKNIDNEIIKLSDEFTKYDKIKSMKLYCRIGILHFKKDKDEDLFNLDI